MIFCFRHSVYTYFFGVLLKPFIEEFLFSSLTYPFPFILVYKSTSLLESAKSPPLGVCIILPSPWQYKRYRFPSASQSMLSTFGFLPTWLVKNKCTSLIMSNERWASVHMFWAIFTYPSVYSLFISFAIFFFGDVGIFLFNFLGAACTWGILCLCDKLQIFFSKHIICLLADDIFLLCKIFLFLNKFVNKFMNLLLFLD